MENRILIYKGITDTVDKVEALQSLVTNAEELFKGSKVEVVKEYYKATDDNGNALLLKATPAHLRAAHEDGEEIDDKFFVYGVEVCLIGNVNQIGNPSGRVIVDKFIERDSDMKAYDKFIKSLRSLYSSTDTVIEEKLCYALDKNGKKVLKEDAPKEIVDAYNRGEEIVDGWYIVHTIVVLKDKISESSTRGQNTISSSNVFGN